MSIQNIPEIIKAVGGDRKKRITLIIILVALIMMAGVAKWTARGDCEPLIKQNEQLLGIQKTLTEQNQSIIEKNRDLSEGYLQIQQMLTQIRPDTVYITLQSPPREYRMMRRVVYNDSLMGEEALSMVVAPDAPAPTPAPSRTVRRTSHGTLAIEQLKQFVDSKCPN